MIFTYMAELIDDVIDIVVFELKLLNNANIMPSKIKKSIIHDKEIKALSLQNYPLILLPKSVELLDIETLILANTPKNLEIFDKIDQVILYPHLKFQKRDYVCSGDEYRLITNSEPIEAQRLDYIHPSLYRIPNLTKLSISYRCLQEISNDIIHLQKLSFFDLSHNKISELPVETGELKELQYLDISNNPIEFLPNVITKLNELHYINLSNTKIGKWDEKNAYFVLSIPNEEISNWINNLILNPEVEVIY
jgi:Leucine-rich repeat (LRR) protein